MRRVGAIGVLLWLAVAAAPAVAEPLPRVAAVGLCADHFALALADPDQIVSLSHQATGPLSPNRARAERYPANRGSAEELLMLDADVVLMRSWGTAATAELLEHHGVRVVSVGGGGRLSDAVASIRRVGDAIGRPAAAAALAAALDARLGTGPAATGPLAAYFRPDGGSAGTGTFVDDVMTLAGLVNLKAELGEDGWRRLDLEAVVLSPPEAFVVSFFDTTGPSLGGSFSRHPVFRRYAQDLAVLSVPGAFWPCAGPHLGDAIDHLERTVSTLRDRGGRP